jgi:hypothetical protein
MFAFAQGSTINPVEPVYLLLETRRKQLTECDMDEYVHRRKRPTGPAGNGTHQPR